MIFKCPICGKISKSYSEIDEKHCCWWSYTNDVLRDLKPEYPINWRDNYGSYDKKRVDRKMKIHKEPIEYLWKVEERDYRKQSDDWMEDWVID